MSSLPSREIDRALLKKGFVRENRNDRTYKLMRGSEKTGIKTILSHTSNMDYGDHLLSMVARQMKLTKAELRQFVGCTMGHEEYVQILKQRGWE
jgi:predicted RNA binding protein YcfA (HicA-like mRNA interferase family)